MLCEKIYTSKDNHLFISYIYKRKKIDNYQFSIIIGNLNPSEKLKNPGEKLKNPNEKLKDPIRIIRMRN